MSGAGLQDERDMAFPIESHCLRKVNSFQPDQLFFMIGFNVQPPSVGPILSRYEGSPILQNNDGRSIGRRILRITPERTFYMNR